MTTRAEVLRRIERLEAAELEGWIVARWVRPQREGGDWRFSAVDLARVQLIYEIRHEMGVEPDSVPVVLGLLDQLYAARRQLRALTEALAVEPRETCDKVLARYRERLAGEPGAERPLRGRSGRKAARGRG